jgi:AmiR/NasT family two-component response regulator
MGNGSPFQHSARVTQASGMVSVQAACTFAEALQLMTDRAKVDGQTIDEIADAVIGREIRFGS